MRVISGQFKGRRLGSLEGQETRPTSDKIKESLFNIIGPYFNADIAVDLFAGSGALGIEAVSRGVRHAYLVDHHKEAIEIIQKNVDALEVQEQFTILHLSAQAALDYFSLQNMRINLLFLDPPYKMDIIPELLEVCLEKDLLSKRALVVCETGKETELPDQIASLEKIKDRLYGKTHLSIFQNTERIGGDE